MNNDVYKCNSCGKIVSILHNSNGNLTCCNQNMVLLKANTQDASNEKHVPVIEKKDNGYLVKIGSVEHPMEEKHYIEFIEVITKNSIYRKYLKPNDKPEFFVKVDEDIIAVREYCNLHGLWENKIK